MKYKYILIPFWLDRLRYIASIVFLPFIVLIEGCLYLFTFLKFRFHMILFFCIAALGCYWYFTGMNFAFLNALILFVVLTLLVALFKFLFKFFNKLDKRAARLIRMYPLTANYLRVPQFLVKKKKEGLSRDEEEIY